eukprot:57113_1
MNTILSLLSPLITSALARYFEGDLTKYIQNQYPEIIFRGQNLRLKTTFLDELNLSLSLKRGCIKSLVIKISVKTFDVYIEANGLYLLLLPHNSSNMYKYDMNNRLNEIQQLLLQNIDTVIATTEWNFLKQQKQKSYSQSILNSITNNVFKNVKINISNIHIRYQDIISMPNNPFLIGITLKQLHAVNIKAPLNDDNDIKKNEDTNEKTLKRVNIDSLCIYANNIIVQEDNEQKIYEANEENNIWEQFERDTKNNYILCPLSLSFVVYIYENTVSQFPINILKWKPQIECEIDIKCLQMSMTKEQWDALQYVTWISLP